MAQAGVRRGWPGIVAAAFVALLLFAAPHAALRAQAADGDDAGQGLTVARLALDAERADALRAIKRLEYAHAHFLQDGEWDRAAALYSEAASIASDGTRHEGRAAIRDWLVDSLAYGDDAPPAKALHLRLMLQPIITLSDDGASATGRWTELSLTGRFGERADWEGGIQVNTYVREDGRWRIAEVHRHVEHAGSYEQGWLSTKDDLTLIPYHFLPSQAGRPVADIPGGIPLTVPSGPAGTDAALARAEAAIAAMLAEQDVLNLQNVYGYYVDRKMWDDVVDLFEADATFTIEGVGLFRGTEGVRRAMERDGPQGLRRGQVNDRMQLHTIVEVMPGADEARTRGLEFGIVSPEFGEAYWELATVESRFVRRGGIWRIAATHRYPLLRSDYYRGWAEDWSGPVTRSARSAADYLDAAPQAPAAAAPQGDIAARIDAARVALARARAYDAIENVSSALGYYLDDFQWHAFSDVMTVDGWKPRQGGYYIGPDAIYRSMTQAYIPAPSPTSPRTNIRRHLRLQPVIDVSPDGAAATIRTRLFLYTIDTERPGSFNNGMYPNDAAALEQGVWKLSVGGAIDEKYYQSNTYRDGWARIRETSAPIPRTTQGPSAGASRLGNPVDFPPQVDAATMPVRLAGFARGSPGWPEIRPMWFAYRNPVSGRMPEFYCPDLKTCEPEAAARAAARP